MQCSNCTLESTTYFSDFTCNFSYPSAKIALISTALLYLLYSPRMLLQRKLPNQFLQHLCLPWCIPLLSFSPFYSIKYKLLLSPSGCSLVMPTILISYFLYDNSHFQNSSQCQPSISTCQIFKQAENVLFLLLGRNPQESGLQN